MFIGISNNNAQTLSWSMIIGHCNCLWIV